MQPKAAPSGKRLHHQASPLTRNWKPHRRPFATFKRQKRPASRRPLRKKARTAQQPPTKNLVQGKKESSAAFARRLIQLYQPDESGKDSSDEESDDEVDDEDVEVDSAPEDGSSGGRKLAPTRHSSSNSKSSFRHDEGFDEDGDFDVAALYGSGARASAAQAEQTRRFRQAQSEKVSLDARLGAELATKQAEIKKLHRRIALAEESEQRASSEQFFDGNRKNQGNPVWSVDDGSDVGENLSDVEVEEDVEGLVGRDEGDLDPQDHPDKSAVTEAKVLHEAAARTQNQTLYRNYSTKVQVQGYLEQLLVLSRAASVQRLNLNRLVRAYKRSGGDADLRIVKNSLRHELQHLKNAVKVLNGKIQGCIISDDCSNPEEAQQLIDRRWTLAGNRPSKLVEVINEVHKSHAYAVLLNTSRSGGKKGGGGGGAGARAFGSGTSSAPFSATSKSPTAKGGKGQGKGASRRRKGKDGGGQTSDDA